MADPLESLASQKSSLDLRSALALVRKRKWLILAIALAVPAVAGYVMSKQPKIYEAAASIVIEQSVPQYLGEGFRDVVEIETNWWSSKENLTTDFRILASESQAIATARALCDRNIGPDHKPALTFLLPDATCKDPSEYSRAAPAIRGALQVAPVEDSRIVNLIIRSTNPEFAAILANTTAVVYLERNLERRLSQSHLASTWLDGQHGDLEAQLRAAEQALVDFKKKYNVTVTLEVGTRRLTEVHPDDQSEFSVKRKMITAQLTEIEVKLITVRAQREMFASIKWSDPITDFSPGLADSPIGLRLKEAYMDQYVKLLELRGKYLEKHPEIAAFERRLSTIKSDLVRELEIGQRNVELQYQTLTKQAGDLQMALDAVTKQVTKQVLTMEGRAAEYNRLTRTFERLVRLSEQVGGRAQETNLASHLKANNVRLLDAARTPATPVLPNVRQSVLIAAALGLLLGIGLALLLESLDNTVKSQEDLEKVVGVTFLGLVPSITFDESDDVGVLKANGRNGAGKLPHSKDLFVWTNPKSSVAECCRSIRTNLLFMSPDKPARTLLITSAEPQEGKTTVAVNLAITLAQSGLSVLLVDTDMRRPRLHRAFGLPANPEGLSTAIVGETSVLSLIRKTDIPNLSLLPCGACPPNPAELLHAERFRRIIDDLSKQFDRIVFDSPPLALVTDPAILASLMDGTILVAKAGRIRRDSLARARRQVAADSRVNVLGCILNDLDLTRYRGYGADYYYYHSRYGAYYGAEEKAALGAPRA